MIWVDLLKELDCIRADIRGTKEYKANPRAVVSADHEITIRLSSITGNLSLQEGPKTLTLELDAQGRPIVPPDLADIFATVPEVPRVLPGAAQEGTRVTRRNPILEGSSISRAPKATTATVLPREEAMTHQNHPPVLEDATEDTVAK